MRRASHVTSGGEIDPSVVVAVAAAAGADGGLDVGEDEEEESLSDDAVRLVSTLFVICNE